MADDRVAQITERCEKAIPGPWFYAGLGTVVSNQSHPICEISESYNRKMEFGGGIIIGHDGDFISHAREDIPWLLGEVENLDGKIGKLAADRDSFQAKLKEIREEIKCEDWQALAVLGHIEKIIGDISDD